MSWNKSSDYNNMHGATIKNIIYIFASKMKIIRIKNFSRHASTTTSIFNSDGLTKTGDC
jgi:hypothetical protein